MTFEIIATGSKGNAVLLECGVLLDCGVPFRKLEGHVRELRLVLLTHEHGDHLNRKTLKRLRQERPMLRFGCGPWLAPILLECGIPAARIDVMEHGQVYSYGDMKVWTYPLRHDVPNCAWAVEAGGEKGLYATDTGSMDDVQAPGFDLYLIEANHTEDEIRERIRKKEETGEFVYEYRAMEGHLSREKADEWLSRNVKPFDSQVVYLHQHQERRCSHE